MESVLRYLPFSAAVSRLDNYLLLHHRMLWISKIHYVLYYTFLITLPLTLAALFVPMSLATGVPDWSDLYWLTEAVGLIGGVYWAYRQTLFSIAGQYGNLPRFMAIGTLGLYLLCGTAFVAMTMLPWAIINWRGASLISRSALDCDVNTLNKYDVYFTYYNTKKRVGMSVWHADSSQYESRFDQIAIASRSTFGSNSQTSYFHCGLPEDRDDTFTEQGLLADMDTKGLAAYIYLFSKYGGKISTTPAQVAEAFRARRDLFTEKQADDISQQKTNVTNRIASIYRAHRAISDMKKTLTITAVLIYYFAIIVWAFAVMGRLEALLMVATSFIFLPLGINVLLLFFQTNLEKNMLLYAYLLVMAIGVALAALNRRNYSMLSLILAGYAVGGLPFILIVLASLVGVNFTNDNFMYLVFSSFALHAVVIMPWLHSRFIRMRALPRL